MQNKWARTNTWRGPQCCAEWSSSAGCSNSRAGSPGSAASCSWCQAAHKRTLHLLSGWLAVLGTGHCAGCQPALSPTAPLALIDCTNKCRWIWPSWTKRYCCVNGPGTLNLFFYDHNECQFAQRFPIMTRVLIVLKVQVLKNTSAQKEEENKHHINNLFVWPANRMLLKRKEDKEEEQLFLFLFSLLCSTVILSSCPKSPDSRSELFRGLVHNVGGEFQELFSSDGFLLR